MFRSNPRKSDNTLPPAHGQKRRGGASGKRSRKQPLNFEALEAKCLLASISYQSPDVVLSIDNVIGQFDGTTYVDDSTIIDTSATLEDPNNPDPPDYEGPVRAIKDKLGNILYPTDSEFGFYVTDFVGAEDKVRDGIYSEGWVGNILDEHGNVIGISIANAQTDTFKSGSPLGTWAAGLGGNSVKASTEHYVVMQNVLSDQEYPGDPNALYPLDDNLILVGGIDDGRFVAEVIVERQALLDAGDTSVDVFPFATGDTPAGDGVIDIRDILEPNESTVTENIAVGNDYSVTLKDDGKLLYRWGQIIKRPNDVRLGAQLSLPEIWQLESSQMLNDGRGLKITSAELIVNHAITNNPNDQIRPEDFENEGATGRTPQYMVIEHPDHPGDPDYALWVSPVNDFTGDGTYLPSYFVLDENGDLELDMNGDPIVNTDDQGNPIGTIFREVTPNSGATTILTSSDLVDGFTNAWYETMDRDPFEAVYASDGSYEVGPRWRLKSNKFGQDLPGVEIPLIPHSQPPFQKNNIKYEVGELTTTTINLLDWEAGEDSPLLYSNGWIMPLDGVVNDDGVTANGLRLTDQFDVAFYVKGDAKATQIYDVRLVLTYELEGLTVTTTADSGAGSLREAIELSNAMPGVQAIDFDIPGVGVQTISPVSPLPALTDTVIIDGSTQPGYTPQTPMIELNGAQAGTTDGLRIYGGSSLVRGLVINQFAQDGIEISVNGGNTIQDNLIGTDVLGQLDLGNGVFGIHIVDSADNVVQGNVVSGNDHAGLGIRGIASTANQLFGNMIGTNLAGGDAIGNSNAGVVIAKAASGNVVGGGTSSGNVISGNLGAGIWLSDSSHSSIVGNLLGTDVTGMLPLGNGTHGVFVSSSHSNALGSNLISANTLAGVVLTGTATMNNLVYGNLIGTDIDGLNPLANDVWGVYVSNGANENQIGDGTGMGRNLISGNARSGIAFVDVGTTNNDVLGNYIGTNLTGESSIGNNEHGIALYQGSTGNRIGGLDSGQANIISGNWRNGILAGANSSANEIVGNLIGTNASGDAAVGNGSYGVYLNNSPGNLVDSNVIAASGFHGVTVRGLLSEFNVLTNNQIGALSSASSDLANGVNGVLVDAGASNNQIGGSDSMNGNTISFNSGTGVVINDAGVNNRIRFNSIYSNVLLGIDLMQDGWTVNDAADPDVGANHLQNYPELASATWDGTTLEVAYFIDSDPANSDYPIVVDFYLADGSGREGQTWLFSDEFSALDYVFGNSMAMFSGLDLEPGQEIVATATTGNGTASTSEFSTAVTIT